MNKAATDIHVKVSVCTYVFISLEYIPRSGSAEAKINQHLIFKELPNSFPKWLHPFTVPSSTLESPNFSTPSPAFIVCRFFDDGHSDWCEWVSHCSFDLYFSNDY